MPAKTCPICSCVFNVTNKYNLRKHIENAHPDIARRMYAAQDSIPRAHTSNFTEENKSCGHDRFDVSTQTDRPYENAMPPAYSYTTDISSRRSGSTADLHHHLRNAMRCFRLDHPDVDVQHLVSLINGLVVTRDSTICQLLQPGK